jgi:hypothetical protein
MPETDPTDRRASSQKEMIVPQPRAQIEEGLAESASFGTENCLEITELAAGPEPDYGKNSFHSR